MKVLQVINSLGIGGAEVLLKDLVPILQKRGIEVDLAILNSTGSYLEYELKKMGISFLPSARSSLYSPCHVSWLSRHLQYYNIVHSHLFPSQLWVAMASRLSNAKTKLITTEHSTYNRRRKSWFRPLDKFMYNSYQSIACISSATASALINWIPDITEKVTIVPNGINLERFRTARAASRNEIIQDINCTVILSIGRLQPQKDHATTLRAIAKVPEAQLVLVGDGEMRKHLERLASDLGIANRVHFLGNRQDIPELIKMSDIFVQSSYWEGFGIAALESMAGGLPVIASNVPGLNNIIEGAGLLFPPGDSDALAKAISLLISSPELRNKLSKAGLEKASFFSIEHTADLYIDLYQRYVRNSKME